MVVILVAIAAGLVAFLTRDRTASPRVSGSRGGGTVPRAHPTLLPQAKWQVRSFPEAVTGKTSKKQLKAAHIQGRRASQAIKNVYNALIPRSSGGRASDPCSLRARCRPAFLHARARLPGPIRHVRTTARSVRIGVDAHSAHRAIATVRVLLKALRHSRRIKITARSTLWLERIHQSWRILAWRAQQGPR